MNASESLPEVELIENPSADLNHLNGDLADSTVCTLRAELKTIGPELQQSPAEPFQRELACARAVELAILAKDEVASDMTVVLNASSLSESKPVGLGSIGPYELLEVLGQGGMGTVYKARHPRLDKIVALKVLVSGKKMTGDVLNRFEREMKAVGKLDHPHLIRALDAGEADGAHYLVMEYVAGTDLSVLVKERGPLPIAEACELISQAALGLQAAHSRGMIHRDIKPANLMLAKQEFSSPVVKVLDLGLALLAEADSVQAGGLTSDGQIMGTVDFMPPEQALDSHSVDFRADIYSLGASLYALLTGGSIFQGRPPQSVMQKLMSLASEPAPPIRDRRPEVSEALAKIVHRMMSRNPKDRFATMGEVVTALKSFAAGANLATLFGEPAANVAELARVRTDATQHFQSAKAEMAKPEVSRLQLRSAGRRRGLQIAIAAALAGVIALGAIVLSLKTPNGELSVEIPPGLSEAEKKQIKIEVTVDGHARVASEANGWVIEVKEGKYKVELTGGPDSVQIKDKQVTVSRRDKAIVTLTLKEAGKTDVPKGVMPSTPATGDLTGQRQTAAWLIENKKIGGIGFEVDGQLENLNVVPTKPFKVRELNFHPANNGGNLKQEDILRLAVFTDLETLNLCRQPLTDAGLASLTPLKQLKSLDVNITEVTPAAVATIRAFPVLEVLRGPETDEWLKALAGMPTLRSMSFHRQELSLRALGWFEQYPKLTELKFEECGTWSHEKLATFKNCKSLSKLTLSYISLDDGKITTLSSLTQLRELDLTGTQVTAEGVRRLAAALPGCRIQADSLTIGGASEQRKLAEWLMDKKYFFRTTAFSSDQIKELPPDPWQVVSVDLHLPTSAQVHEFADLAAPLGTINIVAVFGSPDFNAASLKQLMQIKSVRNINLLLRQNAGALKGADLELLSELPHLTNVGFGDSGAINDDAIKAVKKLTKVVELSINSCAITDAGVEQLQEMPQLKSIYVNSTHLTDKIWETLGQLSHLEGLTVVGHLGVTGQGVSQLQQKPLEYLNLDGVKLSNQSLEELTSLPALRHLNIHNTPIDDEGLKHLAASKLVSLNVRGTKVTEAGVKQLATALPKCRIEWDGGVIEPSSDPVRASQ